MCQFQEQEAVHEATTYLHNALESMHEEGLSVTKLEMLARVRVALYQVATLLHQVVIQKRKSAIHSETNKLFLVAKKMCQSEHFQWPR